MSGQIELRSDEGVVPALRRLAQRRLVHCRMLPHVDRAIVDPAKVRDYLLSTSHPVGRFKARVFLALGYSPDRWEALRDDLLALARSGDAVAGQPSPFGRKYEVSGILAGPSGRTARFITVWLLAPGKEQPTFITAYPG